MSWIFPGRLYNQESMILMILLWASFFSSVAPHGPPSSELRVPPAIFKDLKLLKLLGDSNKREKQPTLYLFENRVPAKGECMNFRTSMKSLLSKRIVNNIFHDICIIEEFWSKIAKEKINSNWKGIFGQGGHFWPCFDFADTHTKC